MTREGKTPMMHRNNQGYSLIELAILFVILVIVSIFVFVSRDLFFGGPPRSHTEELGVAVIRMGIAEYGKQSEEEDRTPVYPLKLDDAPAGTEASDETPLFVRVLPEGIRSGWRKEDANEYVYLSEGGQGGAERTYYYDPLKGTFGSDPPEARQVQFTRRTKPETAVGVTDGEPPRISLDVQYERNTGSSPQSPDSMEARPDGTRHRPGVGDSGGDGGPDHGFAAQSGP